MKFLHFFFLKKNCLKIFFKNVMIMLYIQNFLLYFYYDIFFLIKKFLKVFSNFHFFPFLKMEFFIFSKKVFKNHFLDQTFFV